MTTRWPWRNERGAVAILVVGVFLALLLFLGFSVDLGMLLRYRRAMQNACDAGAMAGALNLHRDPATASPTAVRYAENDMRQNNIAWDPARLTATVHPYNEHPNRMVRVEIHSDVPTYLWRPIRETVHVAVSCMARLTPIVLTQGLVPLGLNYDAWAPLYDPTTGGPCASYVMNGTPVEDRPAECQNVAITADISGHEDNPWGSGNTGLLSMSCFDCPGGGGAQWRDYFINGAPTRFCYDANRTAPVNDVQVNGEPCANVRTEPGVMVGPIRTGVEERCSYAAPPESLQRIIMMPLLNPAYIEGGSGTYSTEIWGFVAFELSCTGDRITGNNATLNGAFVSIVTMQAYGSETEFDTGVYTVRLVQ